MNKYFSPGPVVSSPGGPVTTTTGTGREVGGLVMGGEENLRQSGEGGLGSSPSPLDPEELMSVLPREFVPEPARLHCITGCVTMTPVALRPRPPVRHLRSAARVCADCSPPQREQD